MFIPRDVIQLFHDKFFMNSEGSRKTFIMENILLRNLIRLSTSKKTKKLSASKKNVNYMEILPEFYGQYGKQNKVVESQ